MMDFVDGMETCVEVGHVCHCKTADTKSAKAFYLFANATALGCLSVVCHTMRRASYDGGETPDAYAWHIYQDARTRGECLRAA